MPPKHKHQCKGCGKKYVNKPQKGCGQCGGGIFSSIGNFFKKTIPNAAKTAFNRGKQILKDNKVVSNFIGSKIPIVGSHVAKFINDKTGYGKKRGKAKMMPQSGAGIKRAAVY